MKARIAACVVVFAATLTPVAVAQTRLDNPMGEIVGYAMDSGPLSNSKSSNEVVFSQVVSVTNSAWLRLYFTHIDLAPGSYLEVMSFADGETQRLDAAAVELWSHSTAYFNGDSVLVELHAAPDSKGNRVAMERLAMEPRIVARGESPACGICAADDRTPSSEPWSGRLMPVGCTASIFCEDSTLVTAGHCVQANLVIQFNVPPSSNDCSTVNPPVADQFPITQVTFQNGDVGSDWGVLRTGRNSLFQTAYERQNALQRIGPAPAVIGNATSVYGYGFDTTCDRHQAQQFSPGNIVNRLMTHYRFNNDIRPGSSGSALMVNNFIVGVVTHCTNGCTNAATRHDVAAFAAARDNLSLCDNTYDITVRSEGSTLIPIQVAPPDTAGAGDGRTDFIRTYRHFTSLTLTAPEVIGGACFVQWTLNDAPVSGNVLTFTVTGAATAVAQYRSCTCPCDWNANASLNSQDFFDFLDDFFTGDADFNDDEVTNSQDFFDFLACFFKGC